MLRMNAEQNGVKHTEVDPNQIVRIVNGKEMSLGEAEERGLAVFVPERLVTTDDGVVMTLGRARELGRQYRLVSPEDTVPTADGPRTLAETRQKGLKILPVENDALAAGGTARARIEPPGRSDPSAANAGSGRARAADPKRQYVNTSEGLMLRMNAEQNGVKHTEVDPNQIVRIVNGKEMSLGEAEERGLAVFVPERLVTTDDGVVMTLGRARELGRQYRLVSPEDTVPTADGPRTLAETRQKGLKILPVENDALAAGGTARARIEPPGRSDPSAANAGSGRARAADPKRQYVNTSEGLMLRMNAEQNGVKHTEVDPNQIVRIVNGKEMSLGEAEERGLAVFVPERLVTTDDGVVMTLGRARELGRQYRLVSPEDTVPTADGPRTLAETRQKGLKILPVENDALAAGGTARARIEPPGRSDPSAANAGSGRARAADPKRQYVNTSEGLMLRMNAEQNGVKHTEVDPNQIVRIVNGKEMSLGEAEERGLAVFVPERLVTTDDGVVMTLGRARELGRQYRLVSPEDTVPTADGPRTLAETRQKGLKILPVENDAPAAGDAAGSDTSSPVSLETARSGSPSVRSDKSAPNTGLAAERTSRPRAVNTLEGIMLQEEARALGLKARGINEPYLWVETPEGVMLLPEALERKLKIIHPNQIVETDQGLRTLQSARELGLPYKTDINPELTVKTVTGEIMPLRAARENGHPIESDPSYLKAPKFTPRTGDDFVPKDSHYVRTAEGLKRRSEVIDPEKYPMSYIEIDDPNEIVEIANNQRIPLWKAEELGEEVIDPLRLVLVKTPQGTDGLSTLGWARQNGYSYTTQIDRNRLVITEDGTEMSLWQARVDGWTYIGVDGQRVGDKEAFYDRWLWKIK